EDGGVLQTAAPEDVSDRAKERAASQLGSLGAGNHFLEVQAVEEIIEPAAANFARANRHALTHAIRESFQEVFGGSAKRPRKGSGPGLGMSIVYDVAHNLAKVEEYELGG